MESLFTIKRGLTEAFRKHITYLTPRGSSFVLKTLNANLEFAVQYCLKVWTHQVAANLCPPRVKICSTVVKMSATVTLKYRGKTDKVIPWESNACELTTEVFFITVAC